MFISKVLKCPSCNTSSNSILLKENEDNVNFLYCVSCKAVFQQNKKDSFFSFYKERGKRKGHLLDEEKNHCFVNIKFAHFHISKAVISLKLALKECSAKVMIDIGCADGGYAYSLKGFYQEYYGFEISDIPDKRIINKAYLLRNAILLHYNTEKGLPIHNESVDVITFIASYDHIADVENVIVDVYNKLKDNGYLIILMQNHSFWCRQLIGQIIGKEKFKDDGHYCFHSPDSLIDEIQSFVNMKVKSMRADYLFLPNLPKQLGFIYFSKNIMVFINFLLKTLFSLFSKKDSGSFMTGVFQKG